MSAISEACWANILKALWSEGSDCGCEPHQCHCDVLGVGHDVIKIISLVVVQCKFKTNPKSLNFIKTKLQNTVNSISVAAENIQKLPTECLISRQTLCGDCLWLMYPISPRYDLGKMLHSVMIYHRPGPCVNGKKRGLALSAIWILTVELSTWILWISATMLYKFNKNLLAVHKKVFVLFIM